MSADGPKAPPLMRDLRSMVRMVAESERRDPNGPAGFWTELQQLRAENERLKAELAEHIEQGDDRMGLRAEVERLKRERDRLRAENEALRKALLSIEERARGAVGALGIYARLNCIRIVEIATKARGAGTFDLHEQLEAAKRAVDDENRRGVEMDELRAKLAEKERELEEAKDKARGNENLYLNTTQELESARKANAEMRALLFGLGYTVEGTSGVNVRCNQCGQVGRHTKDCALAMALSCDAGRDYVHKSELVTLESHYRAEVERARAQAIEECVNALDEQQQRHRNSAAACRGSYNHDDAGRWDTRASECRAIEKMVRALGKKKAGET